MKLSANSIGIIGGADGPTSVYIAASNGVKWVFMLAAAVLAAVIWLLVRRFKRTKV